MEGIKQLEAVFGILAAEGNPHLEALREGIDHLKAELAEKEADQRDLKASLEQQVMDMTREAEENRQKWRRKIIPLYIEWMDDDPAA